MQQHVRWMMIATAWAASAAGAAAALPDDGRVELTLTGASWPYEEPAKRGDVTLYLDRRGGKWAPVLTADARFQSVATHDGYVVEASSEGGRHTVLLRLRYRRDKWHDTVAEAAYRVQISTAEAKCTGTWKGVLNGQKGEGAVSGALRPARQFADIHPTARGEYPRLLVRKSQLADLRDRAKTKWGAGQLEALREDRGSAVAQAMAYALTGEQAHADTARMLIGKSIDANQWHHIGIAHAPAFTAVEMLIAYDLIRDACEPAFRERVRETVADKLRMYYWGAYNSQFNNKRTSNWSLMYRSACGLAALSLLDEPAEAVPLPETDWPAELPRLGPPKDVDAGNGVPVIALDAEKPVGAWLFAGPVEEGPDADAFANAGGFGAARPNLETKLGEAAFVKLDGPQLKDSVVDLAALTERAYFRGCYLYTVLDVTKGGWFRLEGPRDSKGKRYVRIALGGRELPLGQVVHLTVGRYPLLVRVWTEPVGGWEPLVFHLRLAPLAEAEAQAWHARRGAGAAAANAFCGGDWRRKAAERTPWNLEALRWATLAAREAEGYFLHGLGEFGWDTEGPAYTQHAVRLGMPLALCWRNVTGQDIRGAERLGMLLGLATARTVYAKDGALMQTFNVGGGPLDVDLYARGFGFLPDKYRPGVLWSWNRSLALAAAGKLKDPHGVIAHHDGLSKAMLLLNYPLDAQAGDPAATLGRVVVDEQLGGYVFRSRYRDGDDCVVQLFANSNPGLGSWVSSQGGTFRITGLGHHWAVRGQGYGNGGSGRDLLDFSKYQNMIDVAEHNLGGSPQAGTKHFVRLGDDGSGTVTLDMDKIYFHCEKEQQGRRWRTLGEKDLGIRATRALAVDYSGASGAPCLVALADRLTGTRGRNTWQLATEGGHEIGVEANRFTIKAKGDDASLVGTVVRPANAKIRVEPYTHVHEVNYHGQHKRSNFKRQAVLVDGTDKDQTFLVILTLQRGKAPKATAGDGQTATIGKRTVRFADGTLTLE